MGIVCGFFRQHPVWRIPVRGWITEFDRTRFELIGYHTNGLRDSETEIAAANCEELLFDRLDSGFKVGTAGTRGVGRSATIQLFHGSEVAFWPFAETHAAGVLQAVPNEPGTEIILESTANGVGGEFHARWTQAVAGLSDYEAIFTPWFWSDEYRRAPPEDFALDDEEADYAALHGLDLAQMVWRRAKMAELKPNVQTIYDNINTAILAVSQGQADVGGPDFSKQVLPMIAKGAPLQKFIYVFDQLDLAKLPLIVERQTTVIC